MRTKPSLIGAVSLRTLIMLSGLALLIALILRFQRLEAHPCIHDPRPLGLCLQDHQEEETP